MTQGSIWRHLIVFSVPMMIGMLFQQLYNTVDSVVVGQYVSKQALAAVGSVASIVNTMIGLFSGLASGAGVVISQAFGAKDEPALRRAVHTSMLVTAGMCVLLTVAGVLLVDPFLRLMSTPDDVFGEAHTYLTIYFAGTAGLLVYNMGSGILRAIGDSKRPLYFLIFSAVTNTVLDLLFVLVFHMGVAGVAWATIIAEFLSALLVLWVLTRPRQMYTLKMQEMRMDGYAFKEILRIGLPSALQMGITAFSNVFVQGYVNAFGSDAMAGWSCYSKLDSVLFIPIQCLSMAAMTFVGQNFGAGDLKRAKKGTNTALYMCFFCVAILVILMMVFSPFLVRLFNTEEGVVEYGVYFIRCISPFAMLACLNNVHNGSLRGVGISRQPVIILLTSFVVIRQIYLYIATQLSAGRWVIAFAYPVGWCACTLIMSSYYYFSGWEKKKRIQEHLKKAETAE